jgi:hypothetical protein
MVYVAFNQPLEIPGFISGDPKKGRRLVSLGALDVNRDIFNFMYVVNSDLEPEDIKMTDLEVMSWTEYGMTIQVEFNDPF